MLQKLTIKNFVLIEEVNVEFTSGLNVITGETGAGKSLILKAINLLIGKKISGNFVRNGANQATIIGVFKKPDSFVNPDDIEIDEEIIIRKVIKENNSSKFYLNDIPVTINLIQKISVSLLEIHGQSEQRFLTASDKQLDFIDSMISDDDLILAVRSEFREIQNIEKELEGIANIKKSASYEALYLKQILEDLQSLAPEEHEYENIENDFFKIKEQEKNKTSLSEITNLFTAEDAICDMNAKAQNKISSLADKLQHTAEIEKAIISLSEQADLIVTSLKKIKDDISNLSGDSAQISERISEYKRLARKYQKAPFELASFFLEIRNKVSYLENLEAREEELTKMLKKQKEAFVNLAKELSAKRTDRIHLIENEISSHFADLNMPNAKLTLEHKIASESEYNSRGIDKITFLFSANPGQKKQEISKVASGGELSRIMLALKIIQKDYKETTSIIFDEIDSGIGGNTAAKLAEKLAKLAKYTQIILVTHQALIADLADGNFLLKKEVKDSKTTTNLLKLSKSDKEKEMKRLFYGEIS